MAQAPSPMRVMSMPLWPSGRVGNEVLLLMAMSVCAGPVQKMPDRRKKFPLTIAFSQVFDLLDFRINHASSS
jgi:hypothetical protein